MTGRSSSLSSASLAPTPSSVEAEPLLDALLEPVRRLLEESADLTVFRDGLLTLYPDLDPAAFAALMGQALAVADASGRWEIKQEAKP